MRAARALRLGPGAARALREAREGCVEIAHPRGSYLRLGAADYVHLAGPRGPFGPLTAVLATLPSLAPGERVRVSLADARPALAAPFPHPGRPEARRAALAAAGAAVPPAHAALRTGIALLEAGDLEAATLALAGRGDGLTPAGDDVLAGFAGARAAGRRRVSLSPLAQERSSPLGLAYLRCAERGELPEAADALLRAILSGDPVAAARRARRLASWGASSGAALFWGIAAASAALRQEGSDPSWRGQPNVNEYRVVPAGTDRSSRCGPAAGRWASW